MKGGRSTNRDVISFKFLLVIFKKGSKNAIFFEGKKVYTVIPHARAQKNANSCDLGFGAHFERFGAP